MQDARTLVRRRQSVLLVLVENSPCLALSFLSLSTEHLVQDSRTLLVLYLYLDLYLYLYLYLYLSLSTGHLVQGSGTILVLPCLSCIHRTMLAVSCVSKECCPPCVFKGRFLCLTVSLRNVVLPGCSKEGSSSDCVSEECCPSCVLKEGSSPYCVSKECCPPWVFKGRFLFWLCLWGMLSFLCVKGRFFSSSSSSSSSHR